MLTLRRILAVVVLAITVLLVACSTNEPTPTVEPQVAVPTEAVAVPTEAVGVPTEVVDVPTEALPATVPADSPPSIQDILNPGAVVESGLHPNQISLDTQGLPYSWQPVIVPEAPYDGDSSLGPQGLPAHIEILFGVTEPDQRQPGDPIMYIIPVDAYRAQWEANDNPAVTEAIADIFSRTNILNVPELTEGYAALPFNETIGVLDVGAQLDRTGADETSATISGYRFIGRWGQSPNPVTNEGLRYVYQGFTNDGRYLVTFFYPVTSPALPMTAADVPATEMSQVDSDPAAYMTLKNEELNALTPADFEPDLETLDALVASLQIEGMPVAGIEGHVWQPIGQEVDLEDVMFTQNTDNYYVTYSADGVMNFKADCNAGSMPFTLNQGGMIGGYLAQPGPMTLAFCGEESLDQTFVGVLQAAQNYRVRPGGAQMELALPAGGSTIIFQSTGANGPAPSPTPLPPIVVVTPEPQAAYGRVIAPAGVFVRTGPGTDFASIGAVDFGVEGAIIGKSSDGQWWVTPVSTAPNGQGWVAAAFIQAFNVENVPVIQAPAVPTPMPTATPQPSLAFWADSTVINQGQCTRLNWNVENIQAVWVYPVGQPYQQSPVTGQGSREVCPQQTTTYEMRVLLPDNSVTSQQITIQVNAVNPLANSSWTVASLYGAAPIADSNLMVFFYDDGRASVSGGCNNFNGQYRVNGSNISIGPLSGTLIGCSDELAAQETTYLNALQSAVTFETNAGQLILRDGSGQEVARFNRIG